MKVLLFDVDGVLVAPQGYREAIKATARHFMEQWSWTLPPPDETVVTAYEAHGITSEWDMVPLHLAALWDAWAAQHGAPPPNVLTTPHSLPPPAVHAPTDHITRLARHLRAGDYPTSRALQLQREAAADAPFPHLGTHPLLETLLSHTRDAYRHPVTRIFQQFALGSEAFTATYGLPADVQTPSFLRRYDRPLLTAAGQARVQAALASGATCAAAYTARPSGPPRGATRLQGYAPEAEMALEAVGLPELPLVGYGRLAWLAERQGLSNAESLLKPAAFHALAAIFAALWRDEQAGLARAAQWLLDGARDTRDIPARLTVVGFDDSTSGLHGVAAAVDALRAAGVQADFLPLGIASHPAKAHHLRTAGATVVADIQQALNQAI